MSSISLVLKTVYLLLIIISLIKSNSVSDRQQFFMPFLNDGSAINRKCPVPDCVIHQGEGIPDFEKGPQGPSLVRQKRDILQEIQVATDKKLDNADKTKLASSFSQGYIDLGARNPKKEGAATLAFVFDTTGSMYDDLKQVIEGAGKILKTVLEKFERPIHDYILVPFNDPGKKKQFIPLKTSKINGITSKNFINGIT